MVLIEGYNFPEELYYHKDHAWAKIESSGNIRVGLDDFYQKSAGDITNIDIPFEGDEISQGETCGRVESEKWLGKLVTPLSGEIIKANEELELDPELINKSPYKKGWIMIVKPSNLVKELKSLLHGENVESWLKKEIVDAEKKKK